MHDSNQITITVTIDPDDDYVLNVKHNLLPDLVKTVYVGPNPTWPSASETHDAVAKAVRDLLDEGWTLATGEVIER